MTLLLLVSLRAPEILTGGYSTYHPGDSCNTGSVLACDTPREPKRYKRGSWHVALRDARRFGCGRPVVVCADSRCVVAPLLDAGPWRKRNGRYRGLIDVSRAVHRALGRPRFLSRVVVIR